MIRVWAACLPLMLVLASCGGSALSTPSAGSNPQARTMSAKFTFTVPLPAAHGSAHSRKPQYLPATTQSLEALEGAVSDLIDAEASESAVLRRCHEQPTPKRFRQD
jgi:hypothetical protein